MCDGGAQTINRIIITRDKHVLTLGSWKCGGLVQLCDDTSHEEM